MENFFYNENFYSDMDNLLFDLELEDLESINALNEDWFIKVENSELQPLIKTTHEKLNELFYNSSEDRYTEYGEESCLEALKKSFDLDKFHAEQPHLYYPTNTFEKITKQDIYKYIS